ncbi:MAG TPA: very short patch repair endonuclease [Methylomirabilota bacterium]|nr:very short patch repair endonuclease [Methylomirabilota bacterium]
MPDVFTQRKRSAVMARIRSRGNRDTELALARLLRAHGITGWRRHLEIRSPKSEIRRLRVKPDFVFRRERLAIFVDGCFWHGCPQHATWPANRAAWWRRKIEGNQARDRLVNRALRRAGWRVLRLWEHELARKNRKRLLRRVERALNRV